MTKRIYIAFLITFGILLMLSCSNAGTPEELDNVQEIKELTELAIGDYGPPKNADMKILGRVYGYINGQQITLNRVCQYTSTC